MSAQGLLAAAQAYQVAVAAKLKEALAIERARPVPMPEMIEVQAIGPVQPDPLEPACPPTDRPPQWEPGPSDDPSDSGTDIG